MIRTVTADTVTRTGADRSQVRRILRPHLPGDEITRMIGEATREPASTFAMATPAGEASLQCTPDGFTLIMRAPAADGPQEGPQEAGEATPDAHPGHGPGRAPGVPGAALPGVPGSTTADLPDVPPPAALPSVEPPAWTMTARELAIRVIGAGARVSYSSCVRIMGTLGYPGNPGEAREIMRGCRVYANTDVFEDVFGQEWIIRYSPRGRRAGWELSPFRACTLTVRTVRRGPDRHARECDSACCYCEDGPRPGGLLSNDAEDYTCDGLDVACEGSAVAWGTRIVDRTCASEPSVSPLPGELGPSATITGHYSDPYGEYEEDVTVTARGGWTPAERAELFRASLRMIPAYAKAA